jgi:hypothetical protein
MKGLFGATRGLFHAIEGPSRAMKGLLRAIGAPLRAMNAPSRAIGGAFVGLKSVLAGPRAPRHEGRKALGARRLRTICEILGRPHESRPEKVPIPSAHTDGRRGVLPGTVQEHEGR